MNGSSSRWPFDRDAEGHKKADAQERERELRDTTVRKQMRFDRFLTGGRAHVRKHGLS
jgi:hypothetical protein